MRRKQKTRQRKVAFPKSFILSIYNAHVVAEVSEIKNYTLLIGIGR